MKTEFKISKKVMVPVVMLIVFFLTLFFIPSHQVNAATRGNDTIKKATSI